MQIAKKEGFKMARETNCPICQKLLILLASNKDSQFFHFLNHASASFLFS